MTDFNSIRLARAAQSANSNPASRRRSNMTNSTIITHHKVPQHGSRFILKQTTLFANTNNLVRVWCILDADYATTCPTSGRPSYRKGYWSELFSSIDDAMAEIETRINKE